MAEPLHWMNAVERPTDGSTMDRQARSCGLQRPLGLFEVVESAW
jgi:hypothetical protein